MDNGTTMFMGFYTSNCVKYLKIESCWFTTLYLCTVLTYIFICNIKTLNRCPHCLTIRSAGAQAKIFIPSFIFHMANKGVGCYQRPHEVPALPTRASAPNTAATLLIYVDFSHNTSPLPTGPVCILIDLSILFRLFQRWKPDWIYVAAALCTGAREIIQMNLISKVP